MRKFITLLTDYGLNDFYETMLLGRIYAVFQDAVVITQKIAKKHDLKSAGFSLAQYYKEFPEGTLHIVLVNDAHPDHQDLLLEKYDTCYVLTFNNGITSYIPDKPHKVWLIGQQKITVPSFKELDLVPLAIKSWLGGNMDELFSEITDFEKRLILKPIFEKDAIVCHIVYVDSYGNCITNLHIDEFQKHAAQRRYAIHVGKYTLEQIVWDYSESGYSDMVALFGKHGYLEIAVVIDSAHQLLGLKEGSTIRIEFEP